VPASIFDYRPDSKTALPAFHNSTAYVKCIGGPPGSGKSVGWFAEIVYNCMRQAPDRDKLRQVKFGVIRATFRDLSKTTRATMMQWIPPWLGHISETAPMKGKLQFPHPSGDGTTCIVYLELMAIEKESDFHHLDSFEGTGFAVNEIDGEPEGLIAKLFERFDRFPPKKDGVGATEPVILADMNAQSQDHWVYKVFVKGDLKLPDIAGLTIADDRPLVEYFEQPPAVFCSNFDKADRGLEEPKFVMNPDADNLSNLGAGYYSRQIQIQMQTGGWDRICTRLMMMWRTVVQGKLVHPEFDRDYHVSKEKLQPVDGLQVDIGFDTSGIHPAAVISQNVNGQIRVYFVLYGRNMGFDEFVGQVMIPVLNANFPNSSRIAACDPADARMGESATSPTFKLQNTYKITAFRAGNSNAFNVRKRAVAEVLGRVNGFIIDGTRAENDYVVNGPFITAISSTYIHKRIHGLFDANGDPVYSNEPHSKNDNSHGIDALQYLCIYHTAYGAPSDGVSDKRLAVIKKKKVI